MYADVTSSYDFGEYRGMNWCLLMTDWHDKGKYVETTIYSQGSHPDQPMDDQLADFALDSVDFDTSHSVEKNVEKVHGLIDRLHDDKSFRETKDKELADAILNGLYEVKEDPAYDEDEISF